MSEQKVTLTRDCTAIQVPYGNEITARKGSQLSIVHQLGDTYTVRSEHGYLLRVAATDADALGLEVPKTDSAASDDRVRSEEELWDVLKSVFDPEIPASIVDLGLVYTLDTALDDAGRQKIRVKMTLTAPGCGMGQVLQDDVFRKLSAQPKVASVDVELVFSPPWDPTMMSDAARLQLGMM